MIPTLQKETAPSALIKHPPHKNLLQNWTYWQQLCATLLAWIRTYVNFAIGCDNKCLGFKHKWPMAGPELVVDLTQHLSFAHQLVYELGKGPRIIRRRTKQKSWRLLPPASICKSSPTHRPAIILQSIRRQSNHSRPLTLSTSKFWSSRIRLKTQCCGHRSTWSTLRKENRARIENNNNANAINKNLKNLTKPPCK